MLPVSVRLLLAVRSILRDAGTHTRAHTRAKQSTYPFSVDAVANVVSSLSEEFASRRDCRAGLAIACALGLRMRHCLAQ